MEVTSNVFMLSRLKTAAQHRSVQALTGLEHRGGGTAINYCQVEIKIKLMGPSKCGLAQHCLPSSFLFWCSSLFFYFRHLICDTCPCAPPPPPVSTPQPRDNKVHHDKLWFACRCISYGESVRKRGSLKWRECSSLIYRYKSLHNRMIYFYFYSGRVKKCPAWR